MIKSYLRKTNKKSKLKIKRDVERHGLLIGGVMGLVLDIFGVFLAIILNILSEGFNNFSATSIQTLSYVYMFLSLICVIVGMFIGIISAIHAFFDMFNSFKNLENRFHNLP